MPWRVSRRNCPGSESNPVAPKRRFQRTRESLAGPIARMPPDSPPSLPVPRIALFDLLRGTALAAMAVYHFSWDLEFFGLAELEITQNLLWIAFAREIAASFLALVGVSLVLAHGGRIRWRGFLHRLALVAAAAAAITILSSIADPDGIIWFGILHCIAVSSLLGLIFLRAPLWLTTAVAAACLAAPSLLASPAFNAPGWLWLGLASDPIPSNDYNPLLPWFGCVLLGIVMARLVLPHAQGAPWAEWQPHSPVARALALAGRHSLLFYLLHQPILMGAVWLALQLTPG